MFVETYIPPFFRNICDFMSLDHVTSEYESELAKELGLVNSISVAVGAMIGGGIFTVLGFLAGFLPPAGAQQQCCRQ